MKNAAVASELVCAGQATVIGFLLNSAGEAETERDTVVDSSHGQAPADTMVSRWNSVEKKSAAAGKDEFIPT